MVATLLGLSVSQSLVSCGSPKPVELKKVPLSVKRILFDPKGDLSNVPLNQDEGAVTVWSFGCKTDFDFDIVEKTFLTKNDYMVTIRIKNCRVELTAPVTVYLPEGADKELIEHEDGHVEICRRIYATADRQALIAASQVIGKTYQASGRSLDEACQRAIEDASLTISQTYHDRASMAVNRISEIYDILDRAEPGNAKEIVDRAMNRQIDTRM
jgi:hypothetical protein